MLRQSAVSVPLYAYYWEVAVLGSLIIQEIRKKCPKMGALEQKRELSNSLKILLVICGGSLVGFGLTFAGINIALIHDSRMAFLARTDADDILDG